MTHERNAFDNKNESGKIIDEKVKATNERFGNCRERHLAFHSDLELVSTAK